MDSLPFNFNNMEDSKAIFTTASETISTTTTESFAPSNRGMAGSQEFYPGSNGLLNLLAQQEPRPGDTAPTTADMMAEDMMNFRMNGTDLLFDDEHTSNYYLGAGANRPDLMSSSNIWTNGSGVASGKSEMMDTFEFLIKSLSSANSYVSMLSREQLALLRCIRPSLLYEFLQEVLKARTDKRTRRPLPNECAFCKNNGENEECYSSHALKDWRGRVLCPVLRAFRCPRCGATGDRAHTIKYCPENGDKDRNGLSSRRRGPPSSLLLGQTGLPASGPSSCPPTPAPPAPSPSPSSAFSPSLWSSYGL
ncbi:uncharacterized protein LOC125230395 [Leguminivora glycinivorella]|uniref:uncharacterized protein LOC125230395 n=1 Tax=Leguminivora glycinivorella TaxID=1035111 RepID=UPI00200D8123|nr:uncharacterized protein LOC125230395 [Leguminivora glycinivorella]